MNYKETVYRRDTLRMLVDIDLEKGKISTEHKVFVNTRVKFRYRYDPVPKTTCKKMCSSCKMRKGLVFRTMKYGDRTERTRYHRILCERFDRVYAYPSEQREHKSWKHQKKAKKQYMKKFLKKRSKNNEKEIKL